MLESHQIEDLICIISVLDRPTLVRQFQQFPAPFPLDFTPQFLETVPLERLRHIFLALCLQCQHLPELEFPTAA